MVLLARLRTRAVSARADAELLNRGRFARSSNAAIYVMFTCSICAGCYSNAMQSLIYLTTYFTSRVHFALCDAFFLVSLPGE